MTKKSTDELETTALDDAGYAEVDAALARLPPICSEVTTASLWAWAPQNAFEIGRIDGVPCVFARTEGVHILWGPPLCVPDDPRLPSLFRRALAAVEARNGGLGVANFVPEAWRAALPDDAFFAHELGEEYLCRRTTLSAMSGGRYKRFRNHVSHFKRVNEWRMEALAPEHLPACERLLDEWASMRVPADPETARLRRLSVDADRRLLVLACTRGSALGGLTGFVVYIADRAVAFAIAQRVGAPDAREVAIIAEKTDPRVPDLAAFVTWLEASAVLTDFDLVNLGLDMGIPGLAAAKSSLGPETLRPLFTVACRHDV